MLHLRGPSKTMTQPWFDEVNGTKIIPLIESTDPVIRVEVGPW